MQGCAKRTFQVPCSFVRLFSRWGRRRTRRKHTRVETQGLVKPASRLTKWKYRKTKPLVALKSSCPAFRIDSSRVEQMVACNLPLLSSVSDSFSSNLSLFSSCLAFPSKWHPWRGRFARIRPHLSCTLSLRNSSPLALLRTRSLTLNLIVCTDLFRSFLGTSPPASQSRFRLPRRRRLGSHLVLVLLFWRCFLLEREREKNLSGQFSSTYACASKTQSVIKGKRKREASRWLTRAKKERERE